MEQQTCSRESAALQADRSGQWEDSLARHFESCPLCREAVQTGNWMNSLFTATPSHRPLPDADLVWIKARLFGRQEAADRAMQPLLVGETLARAIVGAFAATWLALSWPSMQSYLGDLLTQTGTAESITGSSTNPWPITLLSMAAAFVFVGIARFVYPLLTRD